MTYAVLITRIRRTYEPVRNTNRHLKIAATAAASAFKRRSAYRQLCDMQRVRSTSGRVCVRACVLAIVRACVRAGVRAAANLSESSQSAAPTGACMIDCLPWPACVRCCTTYTRAKCSSRNYLPRPTPNHHALIALTACCAVAYAPSISSTYAVLFAQRMSQTKRCRCVVVYDSECKPLNSTVACERSRDREQC